MNFVRSYRAEEVIVVGLHGESVGATEMEEKFRRKKPDSRQQTWKSEESGVKNGLRFATMVLNDTTETEFDRTREVRPF
jgi:hypothetical protein